MSCLCVGLCYAACFLTGKQPGFCVCRSRDRLRGVWRMNVWCEGLLCCVCVANQVHSRGVQPTPLDFRFAPLKAGVKLAPTMRAVLAHSDADYYLHFDHDDDDNDDDDDDL